MGVLQIARYISPASRLKRFSIEYLHDTGLLCSLRGRKRLHGS